MGLSGVENGGPAALVFLPSASSMRASQSLRVQRILKVVNSRSLQRWSHLFAATIAADSEDRMCLSLDMEL
jgi:hypothetical protein